MSDTEISEPNGVETVRLNATETSQRVGVNFSADSESSEHSGGRSVHPDDDETPGQASPTSSEPATLFLDEKGFNTPEMLTATTGVIGGKKSSFEEIQVKTKSLKSVYFDNLFHQASFGQGISVGDELVARMFHPASNTYCDPPHGLACRCTVAFIWPSTACSNADLGLIEVEMRTIGGFDVYNIEKVMVLVERLVLASDWILARHVSGLTVRGCPVSIGSPLAVGVQASSSALFFAGSVLERDLASSELYKRGKSKVSVLVIGFFCCKKKYDSPGAVFHVSACITQVNFSDEVHAGYPFGRLESVSASQV